MADAEPLVTIVSVVYNDAEGLRRTACSVRALTEVPFEYVVIDGGSTDGTVAVAEDLNETIDRFVSEPDDGIYDAMNKAIAMARGEWIVFMNAGDEFAAPDVLSELLARGEPGADLLYADRIVVETDSSERYEKAGPHQDLPKAVTVFHQSVLQRTSLLRERPYDTTFKLAADYDFFVAMLEAGRSFAYVPLAFSRFYAGGRSRQQHGISWAEQIRVLAKVNDRPALWARHRAVRALMATMLPTYLGDAARMFRAAVPNGTVRAQRGAQGALPQLYAIPAERRFQGVLDQVNAFLVQLEPDPADLPSGRRISVVTVCYNAAEDLERTIRSLAEQVYDDLQYVVVDGASTDDTEGVLSRWAHRVDVCVSEPDEGIYDAMNKGLDLCDGDYVVFLNAGDEFADPNVLARVFAVGRQGDVVYGDRIFRRLSGAMQPQKARPMASLVERMPFCHQAAFYKVATLRRFPFDTSYQFAADYLQVVALHRAGATFEQIDESVCIFEEGGRSQSGIRPYLEVLKIQFDHFPPEEVRERSVYLRGFKANAADLLGLET